MSVGEPYSSYSNATQGSFHFYSNASIADSDNEREGYSGAPSYSNDESNIEDDISEGMEGLSDSEEGTEERYHNNGASFTTTEDEEDDEEMDVCSSDTESEDTEGEELQINNNSNIQSQTFSNGNSFNMIRNNNGPSNGNNSNNNNNNLLPPIQLTPRNPSISTSNINNNRFMGSDPSTFMDRFLPIHHSSRNGSSARDHSGGLNIPPFSDNFSSPPHQSIFRFPNVSHPPSSYPNSTNATVASSLSSISSVSSSTSNQRKQSPLRFGFPEESHDNEKEEDEDGTSSSASYDAASSRKRTRSISNDWTNISQSSFSQPIQFGSLEPVNRDMPNRPPISQNLRSTQLSQSPPLPNNRTTGSRVSLNYLPDNEDAHPAPLSPPPNLLSLYPSNRIGSFPPNPQSSTSTATNSSNDHPFARSQNHSQIHSQTHSQSQSQSQQPFYYNRLFSTRRFSHTIPQPLEPPSLRRPTSNHNGNEQQEYNPNFAPTSQDVPIVMFPEVHPPERRHHHQHNSHISSLSQVPRAPSSSSTTTSRWSARDPRGGRTEVLSRPIMPNPNFQRRGAMIHHRNNNNNSSNNHPNFGGSMQETVRVITSDDEQDTTVEVPESSDGEVNVTASIPTIRTQWRPLRRHESRHDNSTRQDNNNARDHRSRALATIAASATASATRGNTSNDGPLSSDEQIARRMQAYEFSNIQSTIDEQNVLARILQNAGRARSATNRRDATSGSSSSSRSDSRRNISTRGPVTRLPEILSHHHEERSNEPRSRSSRGSQSRNGGRSSSASSYLHHQFFPHPFLGNLIDAGEIELEDFLDLLPVWGNGIAANPDNYLDEDEFDSSYEGLLRLCERIGDAKPKGVPEDIMKTLPTNTYIAGKSKTVEERCTICLTKYEDNDMLRDLPCSHDFHQDCIDVWFKNSDKCPICRHGIMEN